MNIQSVKQLVWVGVISLSGALGWEVWDFSKNKQAEEQYVPQEQVDQAIYGDVKTGVKEVTRPTVLVSSLNDGFGNLNWTGKQPEVIVKTEVDPDVEKPVAKDRVTDLLTIISHAYSSDEKIAFAYVEFVNSELAVLMEAPSEHVLRRGDRLKGKFDHVEVERIEATGVRFKFNGQERESELVAFVSEEKGGVKLALFSKGAVRPANNSLGRVSTQAARSFRRPERTVQTKRNHYQLGTESMAEVNRDYTRILSNDIRYRRARGRSGSKRKGLEITKVTPGSIPAEAGLVAGEVLISVNGHQVISESDLIQYIKRESANTTEWEAVFELNGKQFTRLYTSPDS